MFQSEYRLRQEIVRVTRIVANQGLVRSSDGNISIRIDEDQFLVTPSGHYKMTMEQEDLTPDWTGINASKKSTSVTVSRVKTLSMYSTACWSKNWAHWLRSSLILFTLRSLVC